MYYKNCAKPCCLGVSLVRHFLCARGPERYLLACTSFLSLSGVFGDLSQSYIGALPRRESRQRKQRAAFSHGLPADSSVVLAPEADVTSYEETVRRLVRHLHSKEWDNRPSNRRRPFHEKGEDDVHTRTRNLPHSPPHDLLAHSFSHCHAAASPRHCIQTKDDF